ncbi:MAG: shikimate kinase [Flavobacteriaceae bacterium]
MKVVLVGYMASGKSSIGKLLAKELEMKFIDLDDYMETQLGKSIATIFSEKGEIYFRKMEHELLVRVLTENDSVILATGGGAPCYGENMKTIVENADYSIYLQLPVLALAERIGKEKETRPLVKNIENKDLPEFIGKHLFERSKFYSQAEHIMDCNGKTMDELVVEIKTILS